jgi:hypothetical protein
MIHVYVIFKQIKKIISIDLLPSNLNGSERVFRMNDDVKVASFIFIFFINSFHGFGFGQGFVVVVLADVKKA